MSAAMQGLELRRPRVGVGALLTDETGRVLLTLRKLPPEADCWSIVGGKLDFLERLEECAIREAREEAGVEIAVERLLCVTDHRLPGEGQHWVSPAFLCAYANGGASPYATRFVNVVDNGAGGCLP